MYFSSPDLHPKLQTNIFSFLLGISTWLSHVWNATLDLPWKPILHHSVDGNSIFPVVQTKNQDLSRLFFLHSISSHLSGILSSTLKKIQNPTFLISSISPATVHKPLNKWSSFYHCMPTVHSEPSRQNDSKKCKSDHVSLLYKMFQRLPLISLREKPMAYKTLQSGP